MNNELEKTFFDTFGFEPHYYCANEYIFEAMLEDECTDSNREKCKTCKKVGKTYPQITDRILLELICILSRHTTIGHYTMDGLKRQLLNLAIIHKKDILKQVRTLFEEG